MDPLTLYGNAKDVIELLKSTKDRYDAIKKNLPSATILIETYQLLALRIQSISENHAETIAGLSEYDVVYIKTRLEELNNTFSATANQLRKELAKLQNQIRRITHAKRTEALCSTLRQDTDHAKQKLDEIQNTLITSSLVLRSESIDCFRYCNTAPPNEANTILDFESLDDNGIPLTCEGRLKAAILTSLDGQSVGAVASGMGGVGKTCTLRALAYDPDIMKRFPDAICFVSLGLDATVANLMERLCSIVEATGGKMLAKELRRETDLPSLIEKVRNWFCGYICLFMFDDLWFSTSTVHGIKRDILGKLSILASSPRGLGGSRLVYSTRDDCLSSIGEVVLFEPRDPRGNISTNILLQCAGAGEAELRHPICKKVIGNILDYCAGLPVALNISGRTVRWKKGKWKGEKKETWIAYWNELRECGLLDTNTLSNNYGKIGYSLGVSLDFLDKDKSLSVLGIPFREVHRALCVMQRQDWISSGVLRTLCGIKDDELAKTAIGAMGRVGVVDEEHRFVDGEECVGLRLHDLVLDYARKEAEKGSEVAMWHAKLIDNTMKEIGASGDVLWWPVLLPKNSFVFRNISRLLQAAGRSEGVWSLLFSAEWIVEMTRMGCVRRLEEDIALCTAGHDDNDRAKSLGMVGKAVRLSASYCADAPSLVWFQLYARLLACSKESEVTRRFLEKVEENAPRPWLKPTKTCVRSINDALVDTFEVDGRARAVGFSDDTVVCCYSMEWNETGLGFRDCDFGIRKLCSDGTRLDLVCYGDCKRDASLLDRIISSEEHHGVAHSGRSEWISGRSPKITLVAVGKDCRYAVTANSDGLVRIWNISTLMPQGEPDTFHIGGVRCIAISSAGKRAVSCSSDCLRMWNGDTGRQEGAALTVRGDWNRFVSISENGNWIVSIAGVELRVWDAESKNCSCAIELNDFCRTAAIKEDGKKVFCGVENVLTIVDPEKMEVEEDLGQSESWISCIDISCDGMLVVSGSGDGAVRVFDVEAGREVAKFQGHKDAAMALSIRNDKKRVISASEEGSVCVWNLEVFGEARILSDSHENAVHDIDICANGRFVVSQDDSDMQVWFADSGESFLLAPPIPRWQISVVSVTIRGDRIISGSKFGRVRVWENESAKRRILPLEMRNFSYLEHYLAKDPACISQVVRCSRNMVVSKDEDRNMQLWNINDENPILTALPVPPEPVLCLGMIHRHGGNPVVAIGLKGGNILLWEEGKDSFEDPLVGHKEEVCCLAFSPEFGSDILVSGSTDKSIILWDYSTDQIKAKLIGHKDRVCCLAVSHDERSVVSGSDDTTVRVWSIKQVEYECIILTGHTASVCCVAIDSDGERVVSGSNDKNGGTVRVWDMRTKSVIHCLTQNSILDVGICRNGKEMMCVSNDKATTVRWWDVESGTILGFEFGGHMGEIQKLATTTDGNRLAVLSCPTIEYKNWNPNRVLESPQVRVWNLENMQCVYIGTEDQWDEVTYGFFIDNESETHMRNEIRVGENRRFITQGERILANSESDICSFDVDYKNRVVAAGHLNGQIAIFKIA